MAVEANLSSNSTKMVVGVVTLVTNAIKIIKELIVFVGYKASKLEVFVVAVAVAVTKRVGKSVEVIRQQR